MEGKEFPGLDCVCSCRAGGLRFGVAGWESEESGTEKQEQHRRMLVGGCVPSKLVFPSL